MKTRPILFNDQMVRAVLEGRKTQTRRLLKVQPQQSEFEPSILHFSGLTKKRQVIGGKVIPKGEYWSGSSTIEEYAKQCPYGKTGDQLWVRETFCPIYAQEPKYNGGKPIEYDYFSTYKHGYRLGDVIGIKKKWTPSIFMPRDASRIQLEITNVSVEKVQSITYSDAIAEGVTYEKGYTDPRDAYRYLWESINGDDSWDANPWVWVIEFEVVK